MAHSKIILVYKAKNMVFSVKDDADQTFNTVLKDEAKSEQLVHKIS